MMAIALHLAAAEAAVPLPAQGCAAAAIAPGFAPGQAPLAGRPAIGRPVELALRPAADVPYAPPPARAPAAGSHGGVFPLTIATPGLYRIALSAKAWVDVVRDGAAVASAEHAHGVPCSGVAKTVAFRLEAGRYVLQLSEVAASAITVRVTHVPALPAVGGGKAD